MAPCNASLSFLVGPEHEHVKIFLAMSWHMQNHSRVLVNTRSLLVMTRPSIPYLLEACPLHTLLLLYKYSNLIEDSICSLDVTAADTSIYSSGTL